MMNIFKKLIISIIAAAGLVVLLCFCGWAISHMFNIEFKSEIDVSPYEWIKVRSVIGLSFFGYIYGILKVFDFAEYIFKQCK